MRSVDQGPTHFFLCLLFGLIVRFTNGNVQVDQCKNYAKHISLYSQGRVQMPPDVVGEWTSSSCEVNPGPQFVLRRIFITSRDWTARFHHYSDGWCVQPTFTMTVSGRYKMKKASERTKGAYRADFDFSHLILSPHSVSKLINILSVAERYCPGAGLPVLEHQRNGKVRAPNMRNYSLTKDAYKKRQCRELFGLHFYSLRLVKLITHYRQSHLLDELYFGAIPTHSVKKSYIPELFHYPLFRANAPSCNTCRLLRMASSTFPPALSNERRIGTIKGEWVSNNCETQSDMFVSRFLRFYGDPFKNERKWELDYYYFADPNCQVPSYVVSASGNYSKDTPSSLIAGASNYAFTLTKLEITPIEDLIVTLLKKSDGPCGDSSKWRAGEAQDVTSTGGCATFEIYLPSTDYDILKVARRSDGGYELYTGQRPTDGKSLDDQANRPQSFQQSLRMCSDVANGVRLFTTEKPTKERSNGFEVGGFTIPADLLPTKRTGNEVELRKYRIRDGDGNGTGIFTKSNNSLTILISILILLFLLLR